MLEALLHPIFNTTRDEEYNLLKRRRIQAPLPQASGVYLPALGRTLPNDWCADASKFEVSAKRDDAAVPVHFWDKRITALFTRSYSSKFSSINEALPVFRRHIMTWLFRRIYLEFKVYMLNTYNTEWTNFLMTLQTSVGGRS